jgi:hypothetical protein
VTRRVAGTETSLCAPTHSHLHKLARRHSAGDNVWIALPPEDWLNKQLKKYGKTWRIKDGKFADLSQPAQ